MPFIWKIYHVVDNELGTSYGLHTALSERAACHVAITAHEDQEGVLPYLVAEEVSLEDLAPHMDDDIREELHSEWIRESFLPNDAAFFDLYKEAHQEKFDSPFNPNL